MIDKKENRCLPSDSAKLSFLTELLFLFEESHKRVSEADQVCYDIQVRTPDEKILYENGYQGARIGNRNGIPPFSCFVQDLVIIEELLKIEDWGSCKDYHAALFDYVNKLDRQGLISMPSVELDVCSKEGFEKGLSELHYASACNPSDHIETLRRLYRQIWTKSLQKTGDGYGLSRIKSMILLKAD